MGEDGGDGVEGEWDAIKKKEEAEKDPKERRCGGEEK